MKRLVSLSIFVMILLSSVVARPNKDRGTKEEKDVEKKEEISKEDSLKLKFEEEERETDSLMMLTIDGDLELDSEEMSTATKLNETSIDEFTNEYDRKLNCLVSLYKGVMLSSDCETDSIGPTFSDDVYKSRLQKIETEFELVFNPQVKQLIEFYTQRRRKQMSYMLGASNYYFPIFEQELDAQGLPHVLRNLPVIESALNPRAFSRVGASGLWQFMYGTGKLYGLQGNSLVDERRDPIKATHAAVRFLRDLYKIYGDWSLVIAAYNCGPGNVNKAIKRSNGKKDFWAIYPYLPKETRGYVPAFIAATYAMTYYKEHKICPAKVELPFVCDTIRLDTVRLHLKQICEVLNIDTNMLRNMNPQYRKDIIPAGDGKVYTLCLPANKVEAFIEQKDSIMAYKRDSFNILTRVVALPAKQDPYYRGVSGSSSGKSTYVVRSGDTLSLIAKRNKTTIPAIKKLNNLRSDNIYIGQKLRLR